MLRSRIVRFLPVLVAVSLLLALTGGAVVNAQSPNLLQNPGFERPYVAPIPGKENCRIAAPWSPWYIEGSEWETSQGYRFAPEYKAAFREDFPGNRVRNGELAQQYFHSFGNFQGGVFQVVPNVTPGARYRAEMWGMTWSCGDEHLANCGGATSDMASPMHLRIGIDPTGGTDAFNPAIVWSPEQNAYDAWSHFEVEAVAQSSTITFFVYSYPDYRSQDNNVYLDDASLIMLGPPPTATPRPTNTPTVTPVPTNTPIPTATSTPTNTPLPTATATATSTPTNTSTPTATATPTATPTPTPVPLIDKITGPGVLVPLAGVAVLVGLSLGIVLARRRR